MSDPILDEELLTAYARIATGVVAELGLSYEEVVANLLRLESRPRLASTTNRCWYSYTRWDDCVVRCLLEPHHVGYGHLVEEINARRWVYESRPTDKDSTRSSRLG